MNKPILLCLVLTASLLHVSPSRSAPGFDLDAGIGFMYQNPAGQLTLNEVTFLPPNWSLEAPYLTATTTPYGWISVETVAPFIPNWRASIWRYSKNGFYPAVPDAGDLAASLAMRNTELTAYYSPLNNWLKLDIGLTLRRVDAHMQLDRVLDSIQEVDAKAGKTIASIYSQASFELPATGLRLGISYSGLILGRGDYTESSARLSWNREAFGVEMGYRRLDLILEEDDHSFAVKLDGPYLGVTAQF